MKQAEQRAAVRDKYTSTLNWIEVSLDALDINSTRLYIGFDELKRELGLTVLEIKELLPHISKAYGKAGFEIHEERHDSNELFGFSLEW